MFENVDMIMDNVSILHVVILKRKRKNYSLSYGKRTDELQTIFEIFHEKNKTKIKNHIFSYYTDFNNHFINT